MRYTKEKKLEILNYAYEYGVMNASRKYHVDEGNIKKWNDKYPMIQAQEAGVDFTKKDAFMAVVERMDYLLKELEELLK